MAELRWNPLIDTWVAIASHREDRPYLPEGFCPFCPGSGRVPDEFDVLQYDNDFPALLPDPPPPDLEATPLQPIAEAAGKCEVTLYSPKHDITLPELPLEHVIKLVDLWSDRFKELGDLPYVKYVFIFENRGEEVGVTMPHPHGQIYAYPFIPLRIERELEVSRKYQKEMGGCLFCDLAREEEEIADRLVYENEHFLAFVPSFAAYPYEVMVIPPRHVGSLLEMNPDEKRDLADIIKAVVGGCDHLFDTLFPYMMNLHQVPADGNDYPYYHFHIEFFSPRQTPDKLKFNAGSETGAWAFINPTAPEEKADDLRLSITDFLSHNDT